MAHATWKRIATAASVQRSSQTIAALDSKVYVYGGEYKPREPVKSDIYVCDLSDASNHDLSETSSKGLEAPQPRVGAVSTALNGKVYIFSGRGGTAMAPIEEYGAFWVLDPTIDTWSRLTPIGDVASLFPVGRSYHAATNDGRNKIFIHAGCPEKGRLGDLWAFDITSRQWSELPASPNPPRGGTSITFINSILYRMNGFDGQTEQGGAIDSFDLANKTWNTFPFAADGVSGPEARSVSCLLAIELEDRPFLCTMFGERDPSNLGHQGAGKMLADVWLFDIEASTWIKVETPNSERPEARGWFAADVVELDGHTGIVVQGGLAESNERLGDMWLLQW